MKNAVKLSVYAAALVLLAVALAGCSQPPATGPEKNTSTIAMPSQSDAPLQVATDSNSSNETVGSDNALTNRTETTSTPPAANATNTTRAQSSGTQANLSIQGSQTGAGANATSIMLEADDAGYYLDGKKVAVLPVKLYTQLTLTFLVRTQGTYRGGLDFKGCNQYMGASAGKSTTVSFNATSECTITSYWPSTGTRKSNLYIEPNE